MGGAHLHRAAASGDRLGRPDDGQGQRYLAGLVQRIGQAHNLQPHRPHTFARAIPALLPSFLTFAAAVGNPGLVRSRAWIWLFSIDSTQSSLAWLARHPRWTPSISPNLAFLSQRRQDFLLKDDPAMHPARRLPLDRRPAGRH